MIERLLFVYGWLSVLTDGRFFRQLFSSLLRIGAILLTIYLIGDMIENLRLLLDDSPIPGPSEGWVALTIQLLLLLGGYAVIHLMMLRAEEVRTLHDPRYALSEVVTVLSRLLGELLFLTLIVATSIYLLQRELTTAPLLPQLQQLLDHGLGEHSSILIATVALSLAVVLLVIGYLCSELIEMMIHIARRSDPDQRR